MIPSAESIPLWYCIFMLWLIFALTSTFFWSWVNVLDSGLVRHYEKHPVVLMWSQALFSVIILSVMYVFADVRTSWSLWLFLFGMTGYIGDLMFFYILDRLDVSVSNAAWAILSLLLSIVGIVFFAEHLSALQIAGGCLMISGVILLSFWNQHVSLLRTLLLLTFLAAVYVPFYTMKNAALLGGVPIFTVFFWLLCGREITSFSFPWFVPRYRKLILQVPHRVTWKYSAINLLVISCFMLGEYFGAQAYEHGSLSLVSITSNLQPFAVISMGWLVHRLIPSFAPRELLSRESVFLKVICFSIVFLGLALLAVS